MTRGRLIFFSLAAGVFIVDRISKTLIQANLPLGERIVLVDRLLWIAHAQNFGAAFGISLVGPYVYLVISAVVAIALVLFELRSRAGLWTDTILGLILGGTVGNAYDRLLFGGSVTDMIEVPHFPIFNAADSAITLGVVLILIGYLRRRELSG